MRHEPNEMFVLNKKWQVMTGRTQARIGDDASVRLTTAHFLQCSETQQYTLDLDNLQKASPGEDRKDLRTILAPKRFWSKLEKLWNSQLSYLTCIQKHNSNEAWGLTGWWFSAGCTFQPPKNEKSFSSLTLIKIFDLAREGKKKEKKALSTFLSKWGEGLGNRRQNAFT